MKKIFSLLALGLAFALAACAPQAQPDMAMQEGMAQEESAAPMAPETAADMDAMTTLVELFGDEEVPPVDTLAFGAATVTLTGNTLELVGTFENLESDLIEVAGTPAHIHEAPRGEAGGVIFPIAVTANPDMRSGAFSLSEELSSEQLDALRAGNFYINVHTENNPGGEIRGQIELDMTGM
jgi:hypothetical protein